MHEQDGDKDVPSGIDQPPHPKLGVQEFAGLAATIGGGVLAAGVPFNAYSATIGTILLVTGTLLLAAAILAFVGSLVQGRLPRWGRPAILDRLHIRPSGRVIVPLGVSILLLVQAATIYRLAGPDENSQSGQTPAQHSSIRTEAPSTVVVEPASDSQEVDIAVITRDPDTGDLLTGTCYVLVDFTNEGCDVNDDGQVTFDEIPLGTYTVRHTADLGAGRSVPDFTINVTGDTGPDGREVFPATVVVEPASDSQEVESSGTADLMSLLPSIADVPRGLIETGRRTRTLPEVAGNYTDPAEKTRLFTAWGWQGNAVASFDLPSGQPAQSGQVNGVYVSIHQFGDAGAAREALDLSLTEQAAGTAQQEVTTRPIGEYSRALHGPMDYGNETTVLVQQGSLLIRVSAAMLDGDPTVHVVSVTEAILLKVGPDSTAGMPTGPASSRSLIDNFVVGCNSIEACVNATITLTTEDGEFIASGTCANTEEITPWGCVIRNVRAASW